LCNIFVLGSRIKRYVDIFEGEPEVDIVKVQKEIEQLEGELMKVQKEIDSHLKQLIP
jgi:type I restriction-modification system DNA methylase subunit